MTTYEIDFGDAHYWVIAEGPADVLVVLQQGLDEVGEEMPVRRCRVRSLADEQMAAIRFCGDGPGKTLLDEVTARPARRLVGCSEWA